MAKAEKNPRPDQQTADQKEAEPLQDVPSETAENDDADRVKGGAIGRIEVRYPPLGSS